MKKIYIIGAIVLVFLIGLGIGKSLTPVPLGKTVHNVQETFDAGIAVAGTERISATGLMISGGVVTTLHASTTPVTAAQVCDSSMLRHNPDNEASSTVTLPTAAALIADCIPNNGDTITLLFEHTGDNDEIDTIAASTSIELIEPSGGDVEIRADEYALLRITNLNGTTVIVEVTSMQDAD